MIGHGLIKRQRPADNPAFPTQLPKIATKFLHTPREQSTKIRVGFPPTFAAVPTNTQ
jgi:hypothetical protein